MKKIIVLLILSFFLFEFEVLSQDNVEDSLLIELNEARQDTAKVNILIKLYKKTERADTEKSLEYIQQALKLAQECKYDLGIGRSHLFIGDNYYRKGDYQNSRNFYNRSLIIFEKSNDKGQMALCFNRMGQLSMNNGNFDESLKYYQKSLKTIESLNDKKLNLDVYILIGNLNFYKGEYSETLKYYRLCLSISKEIGDEAAISSCLMNIGNVNANFGNYAEALKYYQEALRKFNDCNDKIGEADCTNNIGLVHSLLKDNDKALQYYKQSLKLYEELNYMIGLINSYINIGQVYANLNNYKEAESNYFKALGLAKENNDKYNIMIIYLNLGSNYFDDKNFTKAKDFSQMALSLSQELNDTHTQLLCYQGLARISLEYANPNEAISLSNKSLKKAREIGVKTDIRNAYKILSDAFVMLNKDKEALKYYKLYKVVHDSIFNEENSEQINDMETRYQTEKKQQQIELQETQLAQQDAEIKQQKILRNTLFGGLGAIFVISLLVGYAYILKRKANKKINAQKDEIGKQKGIIEKKNIHITDSINYAKRIQESVFLSGNEMKQHFRDSFLLNQPKDIVSGDFFWFTEVNNKKIFAVVDCTGHGVPGAFMSLIGNSLLNEIVKEKKIYEPSDILNALHLGVIGVLRQGTEQSKANDGMDMVICVYDEMKKELHFSGARNFMYLKNGKDLEILEGDPFSIGEMPFRKDLDVKFNTKTVKINGETKIYLMTDGYMDQFGGPKLKKFNQGPFEEMLLKNLHLPMSEQKEKMTQTFTDWKGSYKQIDDVMVLGISLF